MTLRDLLAVVHYMDIKIMSLGENGEAIPIYEGRSNYFRMNDYEAKLEVLWIAPDRYVSGGLFVMVE